MDRGRYDTRLPAGRRVKDRGACAAPPSKWERSQGLHEAHTIAVTFELPKDTPLAEASFRVFRSNGQRTREAEGETQARQGKVAITVLPMELVTLERVP